MEDINNGSATEHYSIPLLDCNRNNTTVKIEDPNNDIIQDFKLKCDSWHKILNPP